MLLAFSAHAQKYSYLGMRYTAGIKTMLASSDPVQPHAIILPGGGMAATVSAYAGVITSSRSMWLAEGGYFINTYDIRNELSSRFEASTFSITYRTFFCKAKNAAAPVGRFMDFDIREMNARIRHNVDLYDYTGVYYRTLVTDVRANALMFSVGFGNSVVVHNRFLLTAGVKICSPSIMLSEEGKNEVGMPPANRIWMSNVLSAYYSCSYLF